MDTLLVYVKAFVQNKALFVYDEDYESFLGLLKQCTDRFDCRIHCFCLLPSCYHVLIEAAEVDLRQCIRYLHQQYGRHGASNAKASRFDWNTEYIIAEKNFFAAELSLYIHALPYLCGMTDISRAYQWSSLSAYISASTVDEFITRSNVMDQLCLGYFWEQREYRKKFIRFCAADIPLHIQTGLEKKCVGSRMFCQMVPPLR